MFAIIGDAASARTSQQGHRAELRESVQRGSGYHVAGHRGRPRHTAGRPARHTSPPAASAGAAHTQHGHASVYARSLAGRRMADGTRFDPGASVVASRTLPLGSHARVTNLRNGRSTIVQVRDRGPNRGRRILDLSPAVASLLGMAGGVAPVAVTPILVASRAEAGTPGRP
ncbi:septal ring lytic transglycosylase RlpA family protein [Pararoseomonas sp. SCSIO 73927]|uniref:septal ring lytic transglycosylase RlpA family protein n=1 Tax=Pararoseomonas sp. SCSIO 73927 TaxID=3114537 RepID=UPI0030D5C063